MTKSERDLLSGLCRDCEAQGLRQVQCPGCQQLVFPRRWVSSFDRCADCVRRDFGLEMRADGKFQKTPKRAAQDKEIRARREAQ